MDEHFIAVPLDDGTEALLNVRQIAYIKPRGDQASLVFLTGGADSPLAVRVGFGKLRARLAPSTVPKPVVEVNYDL